MLKSYNKYLVYILIIFVIIFSIALRIYSFPRDGQNYYRDFSSHFYDMKIHYESNTFPHLGARFEMGDLNDNSQPRVPGGFFYLHFLICYKLANGNLFIARIYNLISMLIPVLLFLYWIFKRFSLKIFAVISSLVLMNIYYVSTNMIFYNPYITLSFSFLFFMMFCEYASSDNSFLPAMLIFPILALMGQAHFAVYYGIVPTVIVYLIIRYKKTLKNIIPLAIGVFLSFLTYLPYLVYEIRNNFDNLHKMLGKASGNINKTIIYPQVHSLFMFPTNEFSTVYGGNNLSQIIEFYIKNPLMYFAVTMLILSIIFVAFSFIFTAIKYFSNKEYKFINVYNSNNNKSSIIVREAFLLFILYLPVTIIFTNLANGIPGLFRYQYGAFGLSLAPIIYLLYYLDSSNRNTVFNFIIIFFILNTFNMGVNNIVYTKYYREPYKWEYYIDVVNAISKDANGKEFSLEFINFNENKDWFLDMGEAFNKTGYWNETENSNIIYYVNSTKTYSNMNIPMIFSNNIYVVYKKEVK